MAGYSKLYVIGGLGGHMGSDGVSPIEFMILVGDADRQWLEARYMDPTIKPMGQLRVIVPAQPDDSDALLDACIAFAPRYFEPCPSLARVMSGLGDAERLDFHAAPEGIPPAWGDLRNEAKIPFSKLNIWQGELVRISRAR